MATTVAAGPRALAQPSSALALPDDDALILKRVLRHEQSLAATYEFAAKGDLLDHEVREAALLFADQEREHAEALTSALHDLGQRAPRSPGPDQIEGLEARDSQPALLELILDLEREAIALYGAAATKLTAPDLLKTGAQIVCNEAQHLVVLRQQLGGEPVPETFETGAAPDHGPGPSGG